MASLQQLTERQKAVYEFVRDKIQNRGYGPTVREIGEHFGINSPNGVMCHLKALERKGLITRQPNMSRAIQLAELEDQPEAGLPLVGQIAAGVMHEAIEDPQRIDFGNMFVKDDLFVLQVKGESMIDAQIADGDYVVVRRQQTAHYGDMVVAQTSDGEATLKFWFPEADRVRLQPANAAMEPIYTRDARVLGVVAGVVRNLQP